MILDTLFKNNNERIQKMSLEQLKNYIYMKNFVEVEPYRTKQLNNGKRINYYQFKVKIFKKEYIISWTSKHYEDKSFQFKNGKYYQVCEYVSKYKCKLC